ncbi:hypothetical protein RRG08_052585 [Elysia crispata]|uniref:Uncharacterized protein n=1 Tax=Elysia crispata TaxID=231223 RepID=A0AAE1A136_9GAST|nr:hypothetical protein RRG08_052585 [Elysia crispata]
MASRSSQTASATSYKNPKLRDIPEVEIDKNGKFKYILIKVHDPDIDREFKHIVRGTSKASFHEMTPPGYIIFAPGRPGLRPAV